MNLSTYLDSTYLKLPLQAGVSEEKTKENIIELVKEAIHYQFKLVMIRSKYISLAKEIITKANANVLIGTVIGFHEGTYTIEEKLKEAEESIELGVDELDFVVNYQAFKSNQFSLIKNEILKGTSIGLRNNKVVKWIIEVAALTNEEIASLTKLIKEVVLENYSQEQALKVFVKSSTGFFKTSKGLPNGATFEAIKIIADNAGPLQIKAAGGVKSKEDALRMIELGVTRIGTSSARAILGDKSIHNNY